MMQLSNYDYSKLNGRIREKGYTQETLAKAINICESSLNQSLNNKRRFRQDEMTVICNKLDIPISDIALYFFTR